MNFLYQKSSFSINNFGTILEGKCQPVKSMHKSMCLSEAMKSGKEGQREGRSKPAIPNWDVKPEERQSLHFYARHVLSAWCHLSGE